MVRFCTIVIFSCAICLLTSSDCAGQGKLRSLKGVVLDASTGLQLTHVSISLKHASSGLSKNTISADNGSFRINSFYGDEFSLEITAVGYEDTVLKVSFQNESLVNLGNVRLVSLVKPLKPVNVYAPKPLIEQSTDKLIYNVDADPENTYLNAFEILRKVPLITTDANDNIQLNGNNDFKIYVNGKPSLLFSRNPQSVLQSLQAISIQSIEVLTTPPARYQSEGASGIININTFRSIPGGMNGGANLRALELNGMQASADITAGGKVFSASINSSYLERDLPQSNAELTRHDKLHEQTLQQYSLDNRKSASLNNGVEFTFQPNEQNVFTAAVIRNSGNNNNLRKQHSVLFDEKNGTESLFEAVNSYDNTTTTYDYTADYTHTFRNNDERKFDVSYKLSQSLSSNQFLFDREPSIGETPKGKNSYTDDQNDYFFEANYAQPVKQHLIEMGITNLKRESESKSRYFHFDDRLNEYVQNASGNGNFDFGEEVKAAYLSLKLKFNRWSFTTAGRFEKADMHFIGYSGGVINNRYSYWMPNVMLSKQFSKGSLVRIGYTQRVTRPDISYLDPFVNNTDAFNISFGNPMLKPTLSHVFNLTYNKAVNKFFFSVNASHQYTDNSIEQITSVGSDTISRTTYKNIGRYASTTGSLSVNALLFKKINVNMNGGANYMQYQQASDLKKGKHSGMTYNAGITATANLKKWGLAAYANYMSPLVAVQGSTTTFVTNSFTVSRRFFAKNNLTASLSASEPFVRRRVSIAEFNDPQFLIMQRSITVNRRVNLSLNYRFARVRLE